MKKHYNLYYLFLEDMQQYPLSEQRSIEILKEITESCEKTKPP